MGMTTTDEVDLALGQFKRDVLTPGEVAILFRVDPKTVTRWADTGKIESFRTPGHHRRFRKAVVAAAMRGETSDTV
jgi:excisionase family DNA binding protein